MSSREAAVAAERYVADPALVGSLQRRTLAVVVAVQVLAGAAFGAGITVAALLTAQLTGNDSLSGLAATSFTLGSALAAFLIGQATQRWGRRDGLALGFAAGGAGSLVVVVAAALGSVSLLLAAMFVSGSGIATGLQARYAGTDLARPDRRGAAVSVAMVSTALGAVAGPNLADPMGALAGTLGLPPLSGPFLLTTVAFLAAAGVLLALMRPDPFLVARALEARGPGPATPPTSGGRAAPGAAVGATVMVLTQVTMVGIMTMTPVHMREMHHALGAVGLVISVHIGCMYLPSPLTGALVDRAGRIPVAIASGATLLGAGVVAAFAPDASLGLLTVALALLGLGWNLGLISGTAMVVDATPPARRPRTQGSIDVLVALGGAGGGAASGLVMAGLGYSGLTLAGGVVAVLLVPVVIWSRSRVASQA
ncbi:MFS transporter [Puerhibacterium puerhi]|uniref:MFS transporter n=1 Tax=Puerhibacterium puerhi TaxID=2692623 RepID=UPI00135BDB93|nr:MFS transporter [Puerhibacterium puerhi]